MIEFCPIRIDGEWVCVEALAYVGIVIAVLIIGTTILLIQQWWHRRLRRITFTVGSTMWSTVGSTMRNHEDEAISNN